MFGVSAVKIRNFQCAAKQKHLLVSAWASLLLLLFISMPPQADYAVPVILDTDLATDCDDAGAVAMLHAVAEQGEVFVLSMGICIQNDYSVLAPDALNTWYGRPDILLVTTKNPDAYKPAAGGVRYVRQLSREYPRTNLWTTSADATDAVAVYRAAMAAHPNIDEDNPVLVMISIGMMISL